MSAPKRRTATARRRAPKSRAVVPTAGTRERLVSSARSLLEEGGYVAASVQAIAERAGVAAGAMYRHFPSKAELFVEVFRDAAKRDLSAMNGAAMTGGCIDRLAAVIEVFAHRALSNRRLAWALVYEPVDPLVDAERLVYRREYCRQMAVLLRQGVASGEIPPQNVELTAAAVVGAIAESLVGPLSPIAGQIASDKEIIAPLVEFCRRAVGARERAALRRVRRA